MASSALESYPALMTAGPAPGVPLVQEIMPGRVVVYPAAFFGISDLDGTWIRTAGTYLQNKYNGGEIYLAPMAFSASVTITIPETVSLYGVPGCTVINYSGSGAAVSHHGSNDSFTPNFQTVGVIKGVTIDGTNAAAGAVGLDVGDGWGHDVDVVIRHFNRAGSYGLWLNNANTWSEKCRFRASVQDCTNAVVFDVTGTGLPSHMYSHYEFYLFCNPGQNGIVIQGGSEPSRCFFSVRGNFFSSANPFTAAVITITGAGSHVQSAFIDLGVECDGNQPNAHQTFILNAAGNTFADCVGKLSFLNVGSATFAAATLNDTFNLQGSIVGDSTLSHPATPTLPTSGTQYTNKNNNAVVYVSGGTVTQIKVNNTDTHLTSGTFRLKGNSDTITITYSVAPTWVWIWETQ